MGSRRFKGPRATRAVVPLLPIQRELRELADAERAEASTWYFKTGPGGYGEGDEFLGVTVPNQRRVARRHRDLPLAALATLLASKVHEDRLTGAIILAERAKRRDANIEELGRFYLAHRDRFNHWDIVDTSAPHVLGRYLRDRDRRLLDRLAASKNTWHRRIAVLATSWSIRHGDFRDTLRLARRLLGDEEDLVHKAVGWMLREVGEKDPRVLREFLDRHASRMPRTMLRYAIEKLPDRRRYLEGTKPGAKRPRMAPAPRRKAQRRTTTS